MKLTIDGYTDKEQCKLLLRALEVAIIWHRGQTREDGTPYVLHPIEVMLACPTVKTKIVALLHDTIEDADNGIHRPHNLYNLFPQDIVASVIFLTHKQQETYEEYIQNIKNDETARIVKVADIKHNLSTINNIKDPEKRKRLKSRYEKALKVLADDNKMHMQPMPQGS